ncbi:MAG: hypothetical protein J7578_22085, partial [Chitinophagaceae bacterium]|nr:hypothetical protein [Chitinophagaceae bacterium]
VLGEAAGRTGVNWVEFSDEQLLGALVQNGFSEQMAKVYMVEIGGALRDGSFMEDYIRHRSQAVGGTSLQDFSREFAMIYQNS